MTAFFQILSKTFAGLIIKHYRVVKQIQLKRILCFEFVLQIKQLRKKTDMQFLAPTCLEDPRSNSRVTVILTDAFHVLPQSLQAHALDSVALLNSTSSV
jgi:hypothetical protein